MLKETPRSLRLYFIFVAVISWLPMVAILAGRSSAPISWWMPVNIAFAMVFTFIAIRFEKLLPKPTLIKVVLGVSIALSAVSFVVSLQGGVQPSAVTALVFSVLICVYLMKSVTRLSKEVEAKNAEPLSPAGAERG